MDGWMDGWTDGQDNVTVTPLLILKIKFTTFVIRFTPEPDIFWVLPIQCDTIKQFHYVIY